MLVCKVHVLDIFWLNIRIKQERQESQNVWTKLHSIRNMMFIKYFGKQFRRSNPTFVETCPARKNANLWVLPLTTVHCLRETIVSDRHRHVNFPGEK